MSWLHDQLDALRTAISVQPQRTERQEKWAQRLLNTQRLVVTAIEVEDQLSGSPDNTQLKRLASIRMKQAKLALDQVWKGMTTHRKTYDAAHGATPEEKRAGWNAAYRQRIQDEEGREVRPYQKRKDMTPEEIELRRQHKREKEKLKKQRKRARIKLVT